MAIKLFNVKLTDEAKPRDNPIKHRRRKMILYMYIHIHIGISKCVCRVSILSVFNRITFCSLSLSSEFEAALWRLVALCFLYGFINIIAF